MLTDSVRDLWSRRRGRARPARLGGDHPGYLAWPLRMRFPRSRLYASVIPILGLALFVGFAGAVLGIGGGFILVLAVGLRFAVELVLRPEEPFSIVVQEAR